MAGVRWITAFLDLPADEFDVGTRFWQSVTGSGLSPLRGEHEEFVTLVPRDGGPYLKAQRVGDGPGGIHLDLHTQDVPALVELAAAHGARVQRPGDHVVMTSPGGFTFCVVGHPTGSTRTTPVPWWSGPSVVDQVCLDIPSPVHDAEAGFWRGLTGWVHAAGRFPEFSSLERPAEQQLRLLLQRLDSDDGSVRAHLDLACADRVAETVRHRSLGAELVRVHEHWTVLRDPGGQEYCLTERDPLTGTLAPLP